MHRSAFLFAFFAVAAAWAQLAPPGPQAAYEGQTVSAVSLIANPYRDLEPFRSVVTQKPGEPYSEKKVEESAAALQKMGGFEKVKVNVLPEIQGLRLNFVLEPAWYLGVTDFPGVGKYFSYTRLLQVVDLPDEDPYDPTRIPVAENALRDFLHRNGYFQSKVHVEPQIDDTHQLVNVSFVVEMGKQARIGSVNVEGPTEPQSSHLLRAARSLRARLTGALLKPGKPYTPERISAATALMRRALVSQRRLASSIQENPPQYHAESNRVDVSFKVEVGAVVTVQTTGAKLTVIPFLAGRQKKKLIPIYSEWAVDQDLVDEGQRNLIDYFQKKGFYDVKVSAKFERGPEQILVVYQIDRGKKHKVDRIIFHGNHELSDKELRAQVTVKKSHIWTHGSLSQKLLKQSADNIQAVYRDRGYEDAKVTPRVVDHEPKIDVAFDVQEGPQTLVEDGNRISATYLNHGYMNAAVKVSVNRSAGDPRRVNVAYAITEHQLVRISEVVYLGQKQTRLSLIRWTAQLPPETPMRRGQMLEAESRLYDLNIFDWSSVGSRKPITDQTDEMAFVKVHEAKRNELTYGFGFEVSHRGGNIPGGTVAIPGGGPGIGLGGNKIAPSQSTFASPRGLVEFNRRNVRGLGETASAAILLSRLDQRLLTTYTQPHFIGSEWSSLSSFSMERTSENPLFT